MTSFILLITIGLFIIPRITLGILLMTLGYQVLGVVAIVWGIIVGMLKLTSTKK